MLIKYLILLLTLLGIFIFGAAPAFAHAVVLPRQVGVASFQDFSLGVPSEKEATTVSIKLMLPPELNFVSPVVKPGWQIEVKTNPIPAGVAPAKTEDGDVADSIPTEIDWTGGAIPTGQKDIFVFSAQVPASETELDWKVIQSYDDGSIVSWTLGPNDPAPKEGEGSYSKTMVVNDLTKTDPAAGKDVSNANGAYWLAGLALASSALALWKSWSKK